MLRSLRQKKQRTLAKAAEELGVSRSDLSKWERGLESPSDVLIETIAAYYDTDASVIKNFIKQDSSTVLAGEGYVTSNGISSKLFERSRPITQDKPIVLDLFSGIGGLSYGFELTNEFIVGGGLDLLPDRINTFKLNHPYATSIVGDIYDYDAEEISGLSNNPEIIVGGPPCQGFSSIRPFRMLTKNDKRNNLLEQYVLYVGIIKPKWFLFENVVGLLNHSNGNAFKSLVKSLNELNYNVDWRVVNAAQFGVPQYRERVIIIGNNIGVKFEWPTPTNSINYKGMAGSRAKFIGSLPLMDGMLTSPVSFHDATSDLPALKSGEYSTRYASGPMNDYQKIMRRGLQKDQLTLHESTNHSEKMLNIIRHAGHNINALPDGMVTSGFSSCYSRLYMDEPSTTITVNFVHPASNRCIHPVQDRALTPREGARLQSFPDRFIFSGSRSQIVKQIGNAVPPLMAQRFAMAIHRYFK